jgi:hypothetical protein
MSKSAVLSRPKNTKAVRSTSLKALAVAAHLERARSERGTQGSDNSR